MLIKLKGSIFSMPNIIHISKSLLKNSTSVYNQNFNRHYRWTSCLQNRNCQIPGNVNPELKSQSEKNEHAWVGPAHPVSNLRLRIFPSSQGLTDEERYFYDKCKETQDWHQQYWEAHNKDFDESKKAYIDKLSKERKLEEDRPLMTEEMSLFYRDFLDKNRKKHLAYNWAWYKKNVYLLILAVKANWSKLKKVLKKA
ncbi:COA8 family protein CBG23705, mitochondrial-like [Stegodyphus dumicola]|uniref:COA8 family protein CBG23705, mitochondrial-like n=1 Tax=Stegodyphus dumicola TaxID=202533 RepID=UPI0015AF0BE7|nr:COA8 family protein CBG23705, mitochondrial-like [Stegodyphus dumicola]